MQEENYVVVLDFGSSKISLTVADASLGSPEAILFHKQAASVGINRGCIVNPKNVSQILRNLIDEAQNELNIVINRAVVNYPRWKIRTEEVNISLDRTSADEYINEEELHTLRDMAITKMEQKMEEGQIICECIAKSYSTDELLNVQEEDILGAIGSKLMGHFLMFLGSKSMKANIDKVMNDLGIDAVKYEFTPIIESNFVLSAEEKMQGVALLEIGAGITSVSVYHNGNLRYFNSIPFGGKHVTADIQMECTVSQTLAENIKLAYAFCTPDKLQNLSDKILKIEDPISGSSQEVTLKYLAEIVNCRMKEILNACFYMIKESTYGDKLRHGIVLTGGGAQIHCLQAMLSNMSGLSCRIAYPHYFEEASDCCTEAMLLKACNLKNQGFVSPKPEEVPEEETPVEETPVEEKKEEANNGEIFSDKEMGTLDNKIKKEDKKSKKEKKKEGENGKKPNILNQIGSMFSDNFKLFGTDEDDEKDNN